MLGDRWLFWGHFKITVSAEQCQEGLKSPPWLLLSGLAAAPAALLTWYWRDRKRRADEHHNAETRRHSEVVAESERQIAFSERYKQAADLLASSDRMTRINGLESLFAIAEEAPGKRPAVSRTLAAFVRHHTAQHEESIVEPTILGRAELLKIVRVKPSADVQTALTLVGRFEWQRNDWSRGGDDLNLAGAAIAGAELSRAHLDGAKVTGANLSHADLTRADLSDADLSDAGLSHADLSGANLSGANLSRADLSHADLSGANFSGANLHHAKLGSVRLNDANLARANLSDANLTFANLSDANLSDANLTFANLSGAYVGGANLTGALLGGAEELLPGFAQRQLDSALGDANTKLPAGLVRPDHWTAELDDALDI